MGWDTRCVRIMVQPMGRREDGPVTQPALGCLSATALAPAGNRGTVSNQSTCAQCPHRRALGSSGKWTVRTVAANCGQEVAVHTGDLFSLTPGVYGQVWILRVGNHHGWRPR